MTANKSVSNLELASMVLCLGGTPAVVDGILEKRDRIEKMGISTPRQWSCFLGQCAHESAGFCVTEENLNYSAASIMRVWPSRYPNKALAQRVARNPERLANAVYGGRMGNGKANGDGWRYHGRGPIQLTGKLNYGKAGAYLGLDLIDNPEMVANSISVGILVAAWFFTTRHYKGKSLPQWADALNHKNITRAINGGQHGLSDRMFLSMLALDLSGTDEGIYKRPIVKKNTRGKSVRAIQVILKSSGYMPGRLDGAFGPTMDKAVRRYQADRGLVADGIIGAKTYDAMMGEFLETL